MRYTGGKSFYPDSAMTSPLVHAAQSGDVEEFVRLSNSGADIFELDADGHSLRWHARRAQAREILEIIAMLEDAYGRKMADDAAPEAAPAPKAKTATKAKTVTKAKSARKAKSAKTPSPIAEKPLAELSLPPDEIYRQFTSAIENADTKQVARLIAAGLDINSPFPNGNPPLHEACEQSDMAVIRLLVEQGADIDARDSMGQTPMFRVKMFMTEILTYLVEQGADMNAKDKSGLNFLDLYAQNNSAGSIRLDLNSPPFIQFLNLIASKGLKLNNQQSASKLLQAAIPLCELNLVRTLLKMGCDVREVDIRGLKPITDWNRDYAFCVKTVGKHSKTTESEEIVSMYDFLLRNGADGAELGKLDVLLRAHLKILTRQEPQVVTKYRQVEEQRFRTKVVTKYRTERVWVPA